MTSRRRAISLDENQINEHEIKMGTKKKPTGNRYRPVDTKTARDPKVRALSNPPSAHALWYHLMTCGNDRSIPGLLVIGIGEILDVFRGWTADDVRARFAEIEAQGMAVADWDAGVVWLPKAIAPGRNEPRAPNNITHLGGREWADVPDCELKWRAFGAFIDYCDVRGPRYLAAAIESLPAPEAARSYAESLRKSARTKREPNANQTRTKREPNQTSLEPPSPSPSPSSSPSQERERAVQDHPPPAPRQSMGPRPSPSVCNMNQWLDLWAELCAGRGEIRAVLQLSGLEVAGLLKAAKSAEWWRQTLTNVGASAYCRGEKGSFVADPAVLLARGLETAQKAHDGRYNDVRKAPTAITPSTERDPKTREPNDWTHFKKPTPLPVPPEILARFGGGAKAS